ncbi:MAG TPA: efflux RND transporter periplasmic adaptor subunit [Elusimicrobiales bacterium]|nr:efflux RND transporter periplasmic adaptor subunit [Elusimicrobiales bacterium]
MNTKHILLPLCLALACAGCARDRHELVTGEAEAAEIDVGVKTPGRIARMLVHEGDAVKKGQRLAYMESRELGAKLSSVQAALEEARQQFDFASKSYERVKNLSETGVLPKQQYDEAKYKHEAARQKVSATEGQLGEVQAYYDELFIKAPIDGEVADVVSREGEIVSAGYPVFTLTNPADQWVVFNLREDKLPGLKKGDTLQAEFPALGKKYPMKVTYLSALGQFAKWKATNELGSFDLKTFEVRLRADAPIPDVRPGMTAFVELPGKK